MDGYFNAPGNVRAARARHIHSCMPKGMLLVIF